MKILLRILAFALMLAGVVCMIVMPIYLLFTGIVYLLHEGSTLSSSEILWELLVILFRNVISIIVGIALISLAFILSGIPLERRKTRKKK